MKKYMTVLLALLLAITVLAACGSGAAQGTNAPAAGGVASAAEETEKVVYVPVWMEPYSVVYYDAQLNRTIETGGDLTEEEISSREDVQEVGLYGDTIAEPNTKVEYDLHGFLQNVYYRTADGTGWQLERPHTEE